MKFLIDMPISPSLGVWLTEQGHEVIHASQIGMASAIDTDILELAQREGRIIITADLDFPRLVAIAGDNCPAMVLFRGGNYNEQEIKRRIEHVLSVIPPQEIEQSIIVVDKIRIRRRRLPIK